MRKRTFSAVAGIGILLALSPISAVLANENDVLDEEAMLITSGDPTDPTYANAGANLRNGVGSILTVFESTAPGGFLCTATVINDRQILTAAHCLRNTTESGDPDPLTEIIVILPSGVFNVFFSDAGDIAGFAVNPLFDITSPFFGAFAIGDVAVIEMTNDLPANVERYDLYRGTNEFGQETRHYGHGLSGKGTKGATGDTDIFYARTGLNQYDTTFGALVGPPFDQLLHDFDSGGSKHNAMDWWFSPVLCGPEKVTNPPWAQDGKCTTFKGRNFPDFKGFGKLEVGVAPGDSGGPGFIDGMVAGVHSFGFTHSCDGWANGTDFTCGLDSSYGEMSGDTRVSNYAGWIDAVGAEDGVALTPIPEPAVAAPSAADMEVVELSAYSKSFMSSVLSRRLRTPVTFEQVKKDLGIE